MSTIRQPPRSSKHDKLSHLAFEDSDHTGFMRDDGWVGGTAFARATDSTFTVTDNATNQAAFVAGRPIRFRATGATWLYAMVTIYAAGTVTLNGIKMDVGDDDELEWSAINRTVVVEGAVAGRFADAATVQLLEDDDLQLLHWGHRTAYLVQHSVRSLVDDSSGTQPHVGVTVAGVQVCTEHTNEGPSCWDTGWQTSGILVNAANYEIAFDEAIELTTDAAGTNLNSTDLSFRWVFVLA